MSIHGAADGSWVGRGTHTRWTRVRTVVNWANLSTPVGLLAARAGGASLHPIGRGVLVATGWRWRRAGVDATTVGSVVLTPRDVAWLRARPALVRHEDRHVTQYAWLLGPVFLPLYLLAVDVRPAADGRSQPTVALPPVRCAHPRLSRTSSRPA